MFVLYFEPFNWYQPRESLHGGKNDTGFLSKINDCPFHIHTSEYNNICLIYKYYCIMKKAINFTNLSDSELIHWINQSDNKQCNEYQEKLITEFKTRDWNYTNLVLNRSGNLQLSCPIYLSQKTLFEVDIPYPSMVNNFFKTVLQPIIVFLDEQTELKGKELVTLPFVADQLFLGSRIKTVEFQDLSSLNDNQIFVFIQQFGKIFP